MNAEVLVRNDGCDDSQSIERYAVHRAAIDFPGQNSLTARRFGLTAHQAATREYFGGARLDVYTVKGLSVGRHEWRRKEYHKSNERKCTIHSHLKLSGIKSTNAIISQKR